MVSTKFKDYNVNSNHAINLIFVHNSYNIANPSIKFKPVMTHQIFDEENIYGYHGLRIDIYFAAHSCYCFVDVYYDEIMTDSSKFGLEPDDIMELLVPWFPNNLMTDVEEFKYYLKKDETDYIYGECVDCFMNLNENGKMTGFRIISCDLTAPMFKEFHRRFQSLIIMFIDAANFIDLDDPSWRILYLYEECRVNGKYKYCPVGFCSMYLFKNTTTIARISQFFIVPFLQKLGLGYRLLDATYNYLKATINDLEEITVESPSDVFTRMRDNLDISYMFNEPDFCSEKILHGFSDRMLNIARLKYKLSNEQARKIYEILRCYWTQDDKVQYKMFRRDVIKHRKTQLLINAKSRTHNQIIEEEYSRILQDECDKFVNSIQLTLKHMQRKFGPSRVSQ